MSNNPQATKIVVPRSQLERAKRIQKLLDLAKKKRIKTLDKETALKLVKQAEPFLSARIQLEYAEVITQLYNSPLPTQE